jgi:GT2 family glycosyltransferase
MQPELSVIIVNYNVAFFLEQCLNSCLKAAEHAALELIVIDNNSVDGSEEMMREKFPEITYIFNKENVGFSKANNQGMRIAKGKYVLLLNPDTVVEEFTFRKTIDFMNAHPEAGGLGVRMLDGRGKFLPESKRGLPTPAVAFYKIFGLSSVFPKSRIFGKYHLGYLNEHETHEIEILSGAFMLMRKSVLDEIGLLDEAFFMYGEDIDLSYRIVKAGHKNYYFPDTKIIHYKGESTKKSSVNYVFVFYRAMIIFAQKHFSQNNAKLFSFLINMAVYFRAALAIAKRIISRSALFLSDFAAAHLLLFALLWGFALYDKIFPQSILKVALPIYTSIWLLACYFSGAYDRPVRFANTIKGLAAGTGFILMLYALLPKEYQFSRLFILIGALLLLGYFFFSRWFLNWLFPNLRLRKSNQERKILVVGDQDEFNRVKQVLMNLNYKSDFLRHVSASVQKELGAIGNIQQLDEIAKIHKANEIIFCAKDTTAEQIISWMSQISESNIAFKIAQPESAFIIGSDSIDHPGELYLMNINAISEPKHIRAKRTFDLLVSFLLLLVFPLTLVINKFRLGALKNLISVFIGQKTIVGYAGEKHVNRQLPFIKKGLLSPLQNKVNNRSVPFQDIEKVNLIYAKDYNWTKDFVILFNNLNRLY